VIFDEKKLGSSLEVFIRRFLEDDLTSTDISKITRKPSKRANTDTRTEERARAESQSQMVLVPKIDNSRALQQNGKDKVVISKALISSPSSKATWKMGKHNGMIGFTLESLTDQTQMPHNGLPRWQSV
ncbi:hypothetical protein Tco_1066630, partial [Tanacetum coccineum]